MPKRSPKGTKKGEDGVQISLYHYNDDNKIMVYLDRKTNKGKKGKGNHNYAGYKSATEGDLTEEDHDKAVQLSQNPRGLQRKLKDKVFIDACYMRGIEPDELIPKSLDDFRP